MISYLIFRQDGSIGQRGACGSEDELPPGAQIIEEGDPRLPDQSRNYTYREYRRMAYPSRGDQLDAIWRALESLGVDIDGDAAKMLERIKAVKLAHPKS